MKITLNEYEGCFCFDLEAETLNDAALLVRFGRNATKEVRSAATSVGEANRDGNFPVTAYATIGKRKAGSRAHFTVGSQA